MKLKLVDTNVLARFLLNDHPRMSADAKKIFDEAGNGRYKLYLDEVVIAELIWLFGNFYAMKKLVVADKVEQLLNLDCVVNPRKKLMIDSLGLFRNTNLSYIDCWMCKLAKSKKTELLTFDKSLQGKVHG